MLSLVAEMCIIYVPVKKADFRDAVRESYRPKMILYVQLVDDLRILTQSDIFGHLHFVFIMFQI